MRMCLKKYKIFGLLALSFFLVAEDSSDTENFFNRPQPVYKHADPLLGWIDSRKLTSLNGVWSYLVDPMNNGLPETSFFGGFPQNKTQITGMELIEYNFESASKLNIPGAWNAQDERLFFYQGPVWLYKKINFSPSTDNLTHIYFEGSNFRTKVFINGQVVGEFKGGYVPFNFEITEYIKEGENIILVQTDNSLDSTTVPTNKTDWWPWGGLIGDVYLVETPKAFIQNAYLQLKQNKKNEITFKLKLVNSKRNTKVSIEIPELNFKRSFYADQQGMVKKTIKLTPQLWSPSNPKLYEVNISTNNDFISDRIGFRHIYTEGKKIFLNGNPIKFKGISMHAEPIGEVGPAFSKEHFQDLLRTSKDLNVNFVRAAHYPYSRHLAKVADEMGLLLWEEVPVYWNIDWSNPETLNIANNQISRLVERDWNRSSVGVWSIANETPFSDERMEFLKNLLETIQLKDQSRLTTAALLSGNEEQFKLLVLVLAIQGINSEWVSSKEKFIFKSILSQANVTAEAKLNFSISIDDPLGELVDIISYNEYFGWYYTTFLAEQIQIKEGTLRRLMFEIIEDIQITSPYNKPIHLSEFGAGAKFGIKDSNKIWSEQYQAKVYNHQLRMIVNNPQIQGITPWILKDFRAMLRPLPGIQDFYNRKGLIDENGNRKEAFKILQEFYEENWD